MKKLHCVLLLTTIALVTTAHAEPVLDLTFNEAQGDTVSDSTRFANDGTIHGAAWAEGKAGAGLEFADGDYVEIDDVPQLARARAFTLDVWMYADSVDDGALRRVRDGPRGASEAVECPAVV